MKIFKKVGILAIAMFSMFTLSSCGDDDDDDGGSNGKGGSMVLNDMSRDLNYAYYTIETNWNGEKELEYAFFSCNLEGGKFPSSISMLKFLTILQNRLQ